MALTDLACRAAKAERLTKLSDGGGLQLWVHPGGGKLWRYAYRFGGKQKLIALGSYPLISLASARDARDAAKRLLIDGIDPAEARREDRAQKWARPGPRYLSRAGSFEGPVTGWPRDVELKPAPWVQRLCRPEPRDLAKTYQAALTDGLTFSHRGEFVTERDALSWYRRELALWPLGGAPSVPRKTRRVSV